MQTEIPSTLTEEIGTVTFPDGGKADVKFSLSLKQEGLPTVGLGMKSASGTISFKKSYDQGRYNNHLGFKNLVLVGENGLKVKVISDIGIRFRLSRRSQGLGSLKS